MKKLRSLYLPAAVVLMAVGAAVATNNAKSSDDDLKAGYYIDDSTGQCIESPQMCSTEPGDLCTWSDETGTHNLFLSDTECTVSLYRPAD